MEEGIKILNKFEVVKSAMEFEFVYTGDGGGEVNYYRFEVLDVVVQILNLCWREGSMILISSRCYGGCNGVLDLYACSTFHQCIYKCFYQKEE